MSADVDRTSQQDKLLEGTTTIIKDNNNKKDLTNKLDYLCDCLKTTSINESDESRLCYHRQNN